MPEPPENHGYIEYSGDEEHYWRIETLWAAAEGLPGEEVPLDAIPWREDGCHVLGDPPSWGALADHCRRAMRVDGSYPVILGPEEQVMDGMHRIVRAFVEGRTTIRIVRLAEVPPPDRVTPRREQDR